MKRLAEEQKQKIKLLAQYNVPHKVIAGTLGLSQSSVSTVLSTNPAKTTKLRDIGEDRRVKLSHEDIAEIRELYNRGIPQKQIAELFKIHPTTVSYYCVPGRKEYSIRLSIANHSMYISPEEERKRAKQTYQRRKQILQDRGITIGTRAKLPKITREIAEQMCEYRRTGMRYKEISALTGYNVNIVNQTVLGMCPELRKKQSFSLETINNIIKDREAGLSYNDICQKYNCGISTVTWYTVPGFREKTAAYQKERRKKNVD